MVSSDRPLKRIRLKQEWVDETLQRIALALGTADYLNGWQMGFLEDIDARLKKLGIETVLTERQMNKLSEILGNIGR